MFIYLIFRYYIKQRTKKVLKYPFFDVCFNKFSDFSDFCFWVRLYNPDMYDKLSYHDTIYDFTTWKEAQGTNKYFTVCPINANIEELLYLLWHCPIQSLRRDFLVFDLTTPRLEKIFSIFFKGKKFI